MSFYSTMQFVWPVLVSAAAWGIAIWALREPDTHSELVRRLTGDVPQAPKTSPVKPQHNQP